MERSDEQQAQHRPLAGAAARGKERPTRSERSMRASASRLFSFQNKKTVCCDNGHDVIYMDFISRFR
jgi:hypothetical protein